jgi:hypothetical protein
VSGLLFSCISINDAPEFLLFRAPCNVIFFADFNNKETINLPNVQGVVAFSSHSVVGGHNKQQREKQARSPMKMNSCYKTRLSVIENATDLHAQQAMSLSPSSRSRLICGSFSFFLFLLLFPFWREMDGTLRLTDTNQTGARAIIIISRLP